MGEKENVVILGGGFVGLVLARRLVKAGVVGKSCEVTVIDRASSHVYTPWLYEVSSGYLSRDDGRRERCKLYTSASVPFKGIPGYKHVRFRQETVTGVDFKAKTVFLSDGLTVRYSILVVAFGTEPNYFGIPGLEENCVPLKSPSNAGEIERRVREVVATASAANRKNISIVGAGASGVEFTGELITAIHKLEERGELMRGVVTVSLIDRKGPLSAFPASLPALATKRLKKLGVHVMSGLSVMSATDKALVLKDAAGDTSTHACDLTIWSGGVMPSAIVRKLSLPMDPKGRILTGPTLAVKGMEDVYCAGDCASVFNPVSNDIEPMTAQTSVSQGMWIAKNILLQLKGKEPKPFPFRKYWDTLIAIGGKYGIGHLFGFVMKGPIPFFIRRIADARYFYWILPLPYAFQKWLKGVILYNKND